MSESPSTILPLGAEAPPFCLPAVREEDSVSLADFQSKRALLVMFLSNHCPYVQHIAMELARLGYTYQAKGVGMVAICSDDAPKHMAEFANEWGFPFRCCTDESQDVARAYGTECTPDFFLFDSARELVYHGRLDASQPENDDVTDGADLRAALDAVLAAEAVAAEQTPSFGCGIKWRADNAPQHGDG